jgi:2,4-dienoyl-CoA reductase-like NADH-dependent reductase (Old Yellow Enzyme family)
MSSELFTPLTLRGVTLRNRVVVSPMCQYSSHEGFANDWHLVHLGAFARGGAALVFTEATAVEDIGRISPADLGLWSDEQIAMLKRITAFIETQGSVPGIQLAHAGRKASTGGLDRPGQPLSSLEGGWAPVAPSALPFHPEHAVPHALDLGGIQLVVQRFVEATHRAQKAGFKVIEVHAAHGYLLHEFLSPLSNERADEYGGSLENRARIVREVVRAVRAEWPHDYPLFVRLSATDWVDGGWDLEQSVSLSRWLKEDGADLIDCSSGGLVSNAKIPQGPGYQTPFAARIREDAGIATGAVGLIRSAFQAEHIVRTGQADLVLLARQMLRDPHWPLMAAKELRSEIRWPPQYARAKE